MNRRTFFRSIALIASSASISPTIFIPKFEPVRWKREIIKSRWVVGVPLEGYKIIGCETGRITSVERINLQSLPRDYPIESDSWMGEFCRANDLPY